jgi:hypothetical protein
MTSRTIRIGKGGIDDTYAAYMERAQAILIPGFIFDRIIGIELDTSVGLYLLR